MNIALELFKGLALIMSISGAYLVASNDKMKRRKGFIIWFLSNTIWLVNSIILFDPTQSILWIYYNWTCYLGFKNTL